MAHTPGPWNVTDNSWETSTVYDEDGRPVALCPIDERCDEENQQTYERIKEANALLIAAAPDLLEALHRIMDYAHTGAAVRDIDTSEQPEFVAARAAIAKAEGR